MQEWRRRMNERLGTARALAESNPVAAQNYAQAAANIAAQRGNAQTQAAVANQMNEIRSINTRPTTPSNPSGATPTGGDPAPGGGDTDVANTYDPDAFARAQADEADRRRRINAIAAMRGMMEDFGLGSLMGKIEQYVKDGYTDPDAIMALIRQTPEYNARFPAMKELAKKNRTISEGEYIAFERQASQLERAYGLPSGMLDQDAVTGLLVAEVSGRELEERVTLAASNAFQTTSEVRQTFRDFYDIDDGGLAAYFLDPDRALPLLNKQFAASRVGAEARMQEINIQSGLAERLVESGIDREQARAGFGRVAGMRGLSVGRGDVATQEQLVGSQLLQDAQAQEAVERAQSARTGRFQQGGGMVAAQSGVTGAGTAATR